MPYTILRFVLAIIWIAACSDPKCPPDYVEREGRCKRCPEGSETSHDECVSSQGGVVVDPAHTGGDAASGPPEGSPSQDSGGDSYDGATDVAHDGAIGPQDTSGDAAVGNTSFGDAGTSSSDTGVTSSVDPCHGISQCVACTSDNQCPDPGACLIKHCNTSKNICEPTFAAAQTACGASKCDGAGQCVGCLNDNDCGAPGECKIRYCNLTTRVCEPKNAPSTISCPSGHCDQGICVQCSTAAECADQTCQTKSCASGQCRYAVVAAGEKGACASGVCTSTQQCRECVGDEQCNHLDAACTDGKCISNACQPSSKVGSCGVGMTCNGMTCEKDCGNGVIDSGEECDPKLTNSWNCNRDTCKSTGMSAGTTYRRSCSADSSCLLGEMCTYGALYIAVNKTTKVCMPRCTSSNLCPIVPGYSLTNSMDTQCSTQTPCYVSCSSDANCPVGVNCIPPGNGAASGYCGGPF